MLHNLNLKVNFSYRIGKMSTENAPRKNRKSVSNDDLKGGEGGQDAGGTNSGGAPASGGASGGASAGGRPGGMPAGGGTPAGGQRPALAPTNGTMPGQVPGTAPAAAVAPTTVGQSENLTGNWQGKMGNFEMTLQLQAEGDTLTGNMITPMGTTPVTDGKTNGNVFSFTLNIMGNTVPHQGKVEGNTITLSSNFQGQERVITLTRVQ